MTQNNYDSAQSDVAAAAANAEYREMLENAIKDEPEISAGSSGKTTIQLRLDRLDQQIREYKAQNQ